MSDLSSKELCPQEQAWDREVERLRAAAQLPTEPIGFVARGKEDGHIYREFVRPGERFELHDSMEWAPVYDRPSHEPPADPGISNEDWFARCVALLDFVPPETKCGDIRERANAVLARLRPSQPPPDVDAQLAALAHILRDLKAGIADHATDVVWYSPIQTACDRIEEIVAALPTPTKEGDQ